MDLQDVKVRELPTKSNVLKATDKIIVEDNDGTKIMDVSKFASFANQANCFNTIDDMKNASLNEGDIVQTLGYRNLNDGGGARYQIVYAPSDLDDGMLIHYLRTSDTLRARLIHDGSINVLQAGAYGDGYMDDTPYITKVIKSGYIVKFTARTYKLGSSLKVPSGIDIDLNGATLYCANSACIDIGDGEEATDINIYNGTFQGNKGICLSDLCKNITIRNCSFTSVRDTEMAVGIEINGADGVNIEECNIGHENDNVSVGVQMNSGDEHGNNNTVLSNDIIISSLHGVRMQGSLPDKNIMILSSTFKGSASKSAATSGINITSSCKSAIISSCAFSDMNTAISLNSVTDSVITLSDITASTAVMYDISNTHVTAVLNGIQRFSPSNTAGAVLFEKMLGSIYLNGSFSVDSLGSTVAQAKGNMTGTLHDICHPVIKEQITIARQSDLTSNMLNVIPGFMNIALSIAYAGDISALPFPSMNGQLIALFSPDGAVLKQSSTISVESDIVLNRYTPVILKNVNGVWTRCG